MSDNNTDTEITDENIREVRKSWDLIKKDWKKIGPDYFIRLFQDYPSIKSYFKMFDNMSWEEIRTSKKLRAHAINFKLGVTSYIDDLEDLETVVILIRKTARNHFQRQIKSKQFTDALTCFIDFLRESGSADQLTLDSWTKVLNTVGSIIEDEMKELEKGTDGE